MMRSACAVVVPSRCEEDNVARSTLRFPGADITTSDVSDFIEGVLRDGAFANGSKRKVELVGPSGDRVVFKGKFDVEGGVVMGGTIKGMTGFVAGQKFMVGTGYDLDFTTFADALADSEAAIALLFTVDRAVGSKRDDVMLAVAKSLKGGDGDDIILSNLRDKTIKGEDGDDLIFAGFGSDSLFGGKGRDTFLFGAPEEGVDRIHDFEVKKDKIAFQPSEGFEPLGDTIEASEFVIGTAAATADQHIIYDDKSGRLFWDEDGVGGAAQVELARLDKGLKLTSANFIVEDFFS